MTKFNYDLLNAHHKSDLIEVITRIDSEISMDGQPVLDVKQTYALVN